MEPVFMGQIMMFGGNFPIRGWAFCDGQLLSIAQNQALFSLLGTIYGGDGRTTFALPDLRGRVGMHPGTGPGLSPRREGQRLGTEENYINTLQMPAHSHALATGTVAANVSVGINEEDPDTEEGNNAVLGFTPSGNIIYNTSAVETGKKLGGVTANAALGGQTSFTGNNQGVNNIAPSIGINYIIALTGPYPSRS